VAAISLAELYGPAVIEWIARDPERMDSRVRIGGVVVAVALEVPLLGFAAYLWRLGARIIRTGRFPAPGVAVARDTVVLRGGEARRRGWAAQLLAAILALGAGGLAVILWRLVSVVSVRAP
jgi:hypothetical protein